MKKNKKITAKSSKKTTVKSKAIDALKSITVRPAAPLNAKGRQAARKLEAQTATAPSSPYGQPASINGKHITAKATKTSAVSFIPTLKPETRAVKATASAALAAVTKDRGNTAQDVILKKIILASKDAWEKIDNPEFPNTYDAGFMDLCWADLATATGFVVWSDGVKVVTGIDLRKDFTQIGTGEHRRLEGKINVDGKEITLVVHIGE